MSNVHNIVLPTKTTYLQIGNDTFFFHPENARKLLERKAVGLCEDCGAYHLSPDHAFTLDEVTCLMSADEEFTDWVDA